MAPIARGVRQGWVVADDQRLRNHLGLDSSGSGRAVVGAGRHLKVELLDTYKTEPTSADIKKNDVSFQTSLVFKF